MVAPAAPAAAAAPSAMWCGHGWAGTSGFEDPEATAYDASDCLAGFRMAAEGAILHALFEFVAPYRGAFFFRDGLVNVGRHAFTMT